MPQSSPLRQPADPPSVRLSCPACGQAMGVREPPALVTMTRCPHTACQVVSLVCVGEAAALAPGFSANAWPPVALDVATFLGPKASLHPNWFGILLALTVALAPPAWLWHAALQHPWDSVVACIVGAGVPAFLLGMTVLVVAVHDQRTLLARARRLRRLRGDAFARLTSIAAVALR